MAGVSSPPDPGTPVMRSTRVSTPDTSAAWTTASDDCEQGPATPAQHPSHRRAGHERGQDASPEDFGNVRGNGSTSCPIEEFTPSPMARWPAEAGRQGSPPGGPFPVSIRAGNEGRVLNAERMRVHLDRSLIDLDA